MITMMGMKTSRKLARTTTGILIALIAGMAGFSAGGLALKPEAASALVVEQASPLTPVGDGFTYQGSLKDGGNPANGNYDFRFTLYDALTGGNVVGNPVTLNGQAVSNGLFTVQLDFGSGAFQGEARYLQIELKPAGGPTYTTLTPRQPITPAPYALFAKDVQPYDNVVVVAKSGGDFTNITAALTSITDNTAGNKYLVWVAPGVYTETVQMKQWVDIEGSGEKTTKITFTGSGGSTGTVRGASNAELRSLTVENTGGNSYAIAIYNSNASPSLLHVTATASGATNSYGMYNHNSSSPAMTSVMVTASGGSNVNYGIFNQDNSSPTMANVTVTASGGSYSYGVANLTSCHTKMTNVTVTASGGSYSYGVANYINSSPVMTRTIVTAAGGTNSYGVYYSSSNSFDTMIDVTVGAFGGSNASYGVYNDSSALTMSGVRVRAANSIGIPSYGIYNVAAAGNYIVFIDNSTITGDTNTVTVYNDSEFDTRIGSTKLSGGNVLPNGGLVTCAGVHDESYTFFASTCP